MKYIALKHKTVKLESKAQTEIDAGDGLVLVPDDGSKVFLHWKTPEGKLVTTYTMTFPTKVEGKLTAINALDKPVTIRAIW
jgi:hypothetical protein